MKIEKQADTREAAKQSGAEPTRLKDGGGGKSQHVGRRAHEQTPEVRYSFTTETRHKDLKKGPI